MNKLLVIAILFISASLFGQVPTPLPHNYDNILILNGYTHIGNGEVIQKSAIEIKKGQIELVKNALTYKLEKSKWDTIIDAKGKHVYPGFIATNSTIGLTEIDAVRATNDFDETGLMNPNVRSLIAYNTDSKVLYTVRTNGILTCQPTPRGGLISGTSSVMAMDGWNWEDAVIKIDDGVHVNWPKKYINSGWWAEPGEINTNAKYQETIKTLLDFFKRAEAYAKLKNSNHQDLKLEAMKGIFVSNKRVYFHADFAPEINDIIDFARVFKLKYPVIVGGYDSYRLAERLKENKFTVMLENPHHLPHFEGDIPSILYELPAKLQGAGLLFCIQNSGSMEVMNTRNLPFLAGTAMAYGLTEEQAIATITLNAAKILGLDSKMGSIEKGKQATLFISDGNALDMRTNQVTTALVKGRFIDLTNHQKVLSEKYHQKYNLK
ncbi:MAG: amidohydrolase family protein [Putridiphycobacter sp.]